MKNFFAWLIRSSADPEKTSLALRGTLKLAAAYGLQLLTVSCALHVLCLAIPQSEIDVAINAIVLIAIGILYIVGGIQGAYGFCRKLWLRQWAAPVPDPLSGQQ